MKAKDAFILVVVVGLLGWWLYGWYQDNSTVQFKKVSEVIYNNPKTGAVWQVVESIKAKLLKDPESYVGIKWFQVQKRSDGNFEVRHRFKATNDKGEPTDPVTLNFIMDPSGTVIDCK